MSSQSNNRSSGFIMGLILGALIGAVVAVLVYRNNKNEVLATLKRKLQKFFNDFTNPTPSRTSKPAKKIVVLPPELNISSAQTNISKKPIRKFLRK